MNREALVECQELSPLQKQQVLDTLRLVLQSPQFSKSKRYPALLQYIVRHTLSGEYDALRERALAAEVFDRPAGYDSSTDSTVRTIAGEVRKRITAYFSEHTETPVRIDLPLGSYVAEFRFVVQPGHETVHPLAQEQPAAMFVEGATDVAPLQPATLPLIKPKALLGGSVLAVVLVALAGVFLWKHSHDPIKQSFWWPVLHTGVPAVVVVGGGPDPGDTEGTPNVAGGDAPIRENYRNTFGNTVAVAAVCDAFRGLGRDCHITPAQSSDDFQNSSLVLIGAFDNVLTNRFLSPLRYQFQSTPSDASGGAGELRAVRIVDTGDPTGNGAWRRPGSSTVKTSTDYALLARFHSDLNDGEVAVIAGLTAEGTASAAEFASSLDRIRETTARAPKNWGGLNFEAILQIDMIDGEPGHIQVIATQFW